MKPYQNKTFPVCLFILFVLGLLLVSSFFDTAFAQLPPCNVEICKSAPQLPEPESEGELVFFPFSEIRGGEVNEFTLAANAKCTGGSFFVGDSAEIIEDPLEGWQLFDVECSNSPGISTTFIENGVSVRCLSQGFISCTFTNLRVPAIPTLSEWGMIAVAAGLGLVGVFFAVRRKRLQGA
jgi:hypothetical protein